MTDEEWLACDNPTRMVNFLRGRLDRKLRLFFCATCRAVWRLLATPGLKEAVEVAERFADGLTSEQELRRSGIRVTPLRLRLLGADESEQNLEAADWLNGGHDVAAVYGAVGGMFPVWSLEAAVDLVSAEAVMTALAGGRRNIPPDTKKRVRRAQADLLRCIVGPSVTLPARIGPHCVTPDVLSLAQAAYEERILPGGYLDRDRLLVMADALEDAGCDDAALLGHLRGGGVHVRGCWVVDLLLGKG
jgi:hypothetical protein